MNGLPLLLADGFEDAIGVIVFVVIAVIVWAVQAFNKMAQKGPQRPQRPGPQRPAQAGGGDDEIGEFLRRAAQRRQKPGQPAAPVPPRPQDRAVQAEVVGGQRPVHAEVLREQARQAARRQAQAGQAARRAAQHGQAPAEAQLREQAARRARRGAVPPTVAPRPEPSPEAPRVALPTAFAAAQPRPTAGGSAAAGLYAMLSEPSNLRQAIVLTEILNRPEDRW